MEIIGTRMFSIWVPVEADPEFKAYVFAAGVTHAMGNQSVDYQLKRNRDEWIRRHLPANLRQPETIAALLPEVRNLVDSRCSELSSLSLSSDPVVGRIIAANTLIRLESTFRAAAQLIRLRFPFEAEAVIRLGFEQVAWSYAISSMTTLERVEAAGPTSQTTALKRLFPGAGHMYGRLSDLAHAALHTHSRVITADDNGGPVSIEVKSSEGARESALLLIVLLDAFLVVSESCFTSAGINGSSFDAANECPHRLRPARKLIDDYASSLPANASRLFERWWSREEKV